MTGELPQYIKELDIPTHQDARGSDLHCGAIFDRACGEAAFNAARQEQFVLDQGRDDNPDKGAGSVILGNTGALQQAAQMARAEEQRQKDNVDTQIILAALDNEIEALDAEIKGYENNFGAQYGDAWREIFANRILDPDSIPEREANESMEDYRERLEPLLIKEILDDNGKIKDEYHNDPEMSEWANWAKSQHDQQVKTRQRDVLLDPNAPQEAHDKVLVEIKEKNDLNQNRQVNQDLVISGTDTDIVQTAENEIQEATDVGISSDVNLIQDQGVDLNSFLGAGPA